MRKQTNRRIIIKNKEITKIKIKKSNAKNKKEGREMILQTEILPVDVENRIYHILHCILILKQSMMVKLQMEQLCLKLKIKEIKEDQGENVKTKRVVMKSQTKLKLIIKKI